MMSLQEIQAIVGGRYRVVRSLGTGGLGNKVIEATDTMLNRQVALKVIAPPGDRARAVREAQVMAQVKSPHLVAVYDCVIGTDDVPFLVMELIRGGPLATGLHPGEPLALPIAIAIVRQVAQGLVALHRQDIVHRDIKPKNILLDTEFYRVVVGDFGLARPAHEPAREPKDGRASADELGSGALGTPSYVSPEVLRGQTVDQRADLYSLGVVFYELLTGRRPFVGANLQELLAVRLRTDPRPPREFNSDIPVELERVALRLLEREPSARFPNAHAFLASLEALEGFFQLASSSDDLADWLSRVLQGSGARPVAPVPTSPTSRDEGRDEGGDGGREEAREQPATDVFANTRPLPELFDETMDIPELDVSWARNGQMGARLIIVTESDQREVTLGDNTIVGRAPSCDVVLHEPSASRQHFAIRLYEDYYLEDLRSRNGTQVNSERVRLIRLNDRDRIAVGTTRMLFVRPLSGEHEIAARQRLQSFDELWKNRWSRTATDMPPDIHRFAEQFTNGLLRQALGLHVERPIPPYRGICGYMVEAHMLWIRQARFPILFVPVTESLALDDIIHTLLSSGAADFLALLVAVPPGQKQGSAALELTRLVADSVFRYDLAVIDHADLRRMVRINDSKTLVETLLDKGIELSRLSPYVVRGPVPRNMFFGREAEIKRLSQNVRNHAVVGGRRMGKSSMFLSISRLLGGDPRYLSFYVNCEACFDYDDFLFTMNSVMETEVEFDNLAVLRRSLTRMAKDNPEQTYVFLLDEVDELLAHDEQAQARGRLFKILRALSHEQIAHFIFSGGRTLYDALHDAHSPFFNFCDDLKLYPLDKSSVTEIVVQPMRQLSITLEKEQAIVDRIFAVTSGHPNLVQFLCHRLVTSEVGRRVVTLTLVDEVVASQEFVEHYVETAWSQATALEKLITLVPDEPVFSRRWLLDRLGELGVTDERAIDAALDTLELYALLRPEGAELHFVLDHFPAAVRRLDVERLIAAQLVDLENE